MLDDDDEDDTMEQSELGMNDNSEIMRAKHSVRSMHLQGK